MDGGAASGGRTAAENTGADWRERWKRIGLVPTAGPSVHVPPQRGEACQPGAPESCRLQHECAAFRQHCIPDGEASAGVSGRSRKKSARRVERQLIRRRFPSLRMPSVYTGGNSRKKPCAVQEKTAQGAYRETNLNSK